MAQEGRTASLGPGRGAPMAWALLLVFGYYSEYSEAPGGKPFNIVIVEPRHREDYTPGVKSR